MTDNGERRRLPLDWKFWPTEDQRESLALASRMNKALRMKGYQPSALEVTTCANLAHREWIDHSGGSSPKSGEVND